MAAIRMFQPTPFKVFADLIAQQLNVNVRFRGREICASYGPPPTIFLPQMPTANETTVKVMFGFCLHEAGHLVYSDYKVLEQIDNYLLKFAHNCFEDEFMERMLDRDFPGAHATLEYSHVNGYDIVLNNSPLLMKPEDKSFLGNDEAVKAQINSEIGKALEDAGFSAEDEAKRKKFIEETGFNPEDPKVVEKVAKRMEFGRASLLWLRSARGYKLPVHDWPTHPWKPIFDEVTTPRPKNTQQCLEAAKKLLEKLGLAPDCPRDERPVEEARRLTEEAIEKQNEAAAAQEKVEEMKGEMHEEIARKQDECLEHQTLLEKQDSAVDAKEAAQDAAKALRKSRNKLKESKASERVTRKRLVAEKKRVRELKKELRDAKKDGNEAQQELIEQQINRLEERIQQDEQRLEAKRAETEAQQADVDQKLDESLNAKTKKHEAENAVIEAKQKYEAEKGRIKETTEKEWKEKLDPVVREATRAKEAANRAIAQANEVLEAIKERDAEIEALVAPGAVEFIIDEKYEEMRNESLEDEIGIGLPIGSNDSDDDAPEAESNGETPSFSGAARRYVPFDTSYDEIATINDNEKAKQKYEEAKREYEAIINETTERLRRLYSPEKNRVKLQCEEGRLDPRQAYRIALKMRGVDIDTSRVWKGVEVRKDPKVAVSLLIDCSGSMKCVGEGVDKKDKTVRTKLRLAQSAACALSQVMSAIGIPHEIIGHTTAPNRLRYVMPNAEDLPHFSRFMPFQGYLFKAFEDRKPATAVFGDFSCADNCDGEAVLWSVSRLAARSEKTKICVVLSDGMPAAGMSNRAEMERHLYTTCKQVEAREKEGLFLFGVGIMQQEVQKFYKNNAVLQNVEDIPKAVLGIVEHILVNLVGSLG
jgi:cobalamin biosynthesis protein CobT